MMQKNNMLRKIMPKIISCMLLISKPILRRSSFILCTLPLLAIPIYSAHAGGSYERGESLSAPCAACHNADGNSAIPINPRLAGQYADYILHSLKRYKSGVRKNLIMGAQVANLSEQDMADLAEYFSEQDNGLETADGLR